MTQRDSERPKPPRAPADPTVQVSRPPVPGRAVRAEIAAGEVPTPPVRPDEPTVTIAAGSPKPPQRTLEFGRPTPFRVTVGPRPRARRRYRTWPWIAAVVLALVVLGLALLVLMLQGATVDGDVQLIGSDAASQGVGGRTVTGH